MVGDDRGSDVALRASEFGFCGLSTESGQEMDNPRLTYRLQRVARAAIRSNRGGEGKTTRATGAVCATGVWSRLSEGVVRLRIASGVVWSFVAGTG